MKHVAAVIVIVGGLAGLSAAAPVTEGLVYEWLFTPECLELEHAKALAGGMDISVSGPILFDDMPPALRLDGDAYCVRADGGGLAWKYSPAPEQRLIPNDGKMIPLWPIRTGVLIDDGKAYFGAALLPWEPAYLCAVNAATGSPEGPGLYCRTMDHVTMEGAILASPARLYMPQGRSAPMVFNRENGGHLGDLEGGGGVFAVLTPDMQIVHGPGNKKGWITLSNADTRDKIATVSLGNAMVVTETRSFVLKDTELLALDRGSGDVLWRTETNHPYTLILAGETLFAGGENAVAAFDTADGRCLATLSVSGRAHGLAVAGGGLFVSTDTGAIHCFR